MATHTNASYSTPRDTFLYLLGLVTLIASSVSFGMIVYQFIDIRFPDVLQNVYAYGSQSRNYDIIRTALATLVVVFPVFFWVSRTLHNDVVAEPEKRHLRIRRWMLYFTVFVAALVIIGDLVTLIHSFLNGDLTTSFVLKVLTILFIAGSTLFYYLSELRDRDYPRMAFQALVIGVVVLAVGYGFYIAGSPQNQRLIRLDDQKISHLQMIQNQLVYSWWQQKASLPATLEALNDPISGFTVPSDPQTGEPYKYRVISQQAHSFELCAEFNKPSVAFTDTSIARPVVPKGPGVNDNWQHDAGHACFTRTIDPSLYPTTKGQPVPAPVNY